MKLLRKFFKVKLNRQLREFFIFSVLFSFANSLILIFEPVFLFTQGFSLSRIAMYYALHYSLYILLLPLGGKFASRFGFERSLSIAMPIFVAYFVMLASMPYAPNLFWVSWIVLTIFKIFYYPASHGEICKFGDGRNRGTELSWLYALTRGVGVVGPMIGGVVALYFGFSTLFVIAAGLALLAVFPMLRTKEKFKLKKFSYKDPWKVILSRRYRGMRWSMLGFSENLVDLVFWPIFLLMVLGSVDRLGYLASFNVLVMTVLGFFIGEISDRFPRRTILRIHLPFMVLGYLFRPLAITPLRAVLTDTLARISFIGVRIPMWYRLYAQGKRAGVLRYLVGMEIVVAITKAITAWGLVWVFAVTAPQLGLSIAFVWAAAAAMLFVFL